MLRYYFLTETGTATSEWKAHFLMRCMNAVQICADDPTLFPVSGFCGHSAMASNFALIKKGGAVWMSLEDATDSWDLSWVAVLQ